MTEITMPIRSQNRVASAGCQWYAPEPKVVKINPAANAKVVIALPVILILFSDINVTIPTMRNGMLEMTFHPFGISQNGRLSTKR